MNYMQKARGEWPAGPLEPSYDWTRHTLRNLAWHYGVERAAAIIGGFDEATEADLARWNNLGAGR